jgi:hypothetical protein
LVLKERTMMKRIDTRLAGKLGLTLVVAVVAVLALATVVSARPPEPLGPDIPNMPHWFKGNVETDMGKPVAVGAEITARATTGSWTGQATTVTDGLSRYGWNPTFYVPGFDSSVPGSGAKNGDRIAFYVLGVRARLYDVLAGTWGDTYLFVSGGDTNLDLVVPLHYTITATAGPGGDISPSDAVQVNYGYDQTFTITADTHYDIADVIVDGVSQGAIADYTFTNVTANHTIAATFEKVALPMYLPFLSRY